MSCARAQHRDHTPGFFASFLQLDAAYHRRWRADSIVMLLCLAHLN